MNQPDRQDESATPPAAIAYMLSVYVVFSFLDTSIKYLVLAGLAPLFIARKFNLIPARASR